MQIYKSIIKTKTVSTVLAFYQFKFFSSIDNLFFYIFLNLLFLVSVKYKTSLKIH